MDDLGVVDRSVSCFTIDLLSVEYFFFAKRKIGRIFTKVEEGLSSNLIHIFTRRIAIYSMEEFIILTSNDSRIARTKLVIEVTIFIIVNSIIGNQKCCCNKSLFILKNCFTASKSSVGVSCYTDTSCIYVRKLCNILNTIIKTKCINSYLSLRNNTFLSCKDKFYRIFYCYNMFSFFDRIF